MKKPLYLLSICLFLFRFYSFAQETEKLKVKITHLMPVGWGYMSKGVVLEGNKPLFSDTVYLGLITTRTKKDKIKLNEIVSVEVKNTNEKNNQTHYPACTCVISRENEIWEIKKINGF